MAQEHCRSLLKRGDIELRFRDLPYHFAAWGPSKGLFDEPDEALIASISAPEPDFPADATINMRAERPDFTPPAHGRKFVFGTPEFRVLPQENLDNVRSAREVSRDIHVLTPSRWTGVAYERFGFEPERIHIVPHGIDPHIFHPDAESRAATRAAMKLADEFVFMSVGAMTANKGIDLLLTAFAHVVVAMPEVRLVLKGADALYPSQELLRHTLNAMPPQLRERVARRLLYNGGTLSSRHMAAFLRTADCYVAPYFAEGFNMPVMEAAGSGVAVICTDGGPTNEFTTPAFTQRIRSKIVPVALSDTQTGDALAPDFDHLVQLMLDAARNRERNRLVGVIGAAHIAAHYTWDKVTDRLLREVLP